MCSCAWTIFPYHVRLSSGPYDPCACLWLVGHLYFESYLLVSCIFGPNSPTIIFIPAFVEFVNKPSYATFIPFDAHILRDIWRSTWVKIERQQDSPHIVLCSSRVKARTKPDLAFIWYDTCIHIILISFTFTCKFWCVYHNCLESWRVEC